MNCKVPKSYQHDDFKKALKDLRRSGCKLQLTKCKSAVFDSTNGDKVDLPVTNHGESRIPNCIKYDLGDGYRLITIQREEVRIFLFAGSHDEADKWLNRHRNFKVVISPEGSSRIELLPMAEDISMALIDTIDEDATESALRRPLFGPLRRDEIERIKLSSSTIEKLYSLRQEDWEDECEELLSQIEAECSERVALLIIDLAQLMMSGSIDKVSARIDAHLHNIKEADNKDILKAINHIDNSDHVIDINDFDILDKMDIIDNWADWMLYLHPEQQRIAKRPFNGPTRLRGVSGSGKTCVLIHRARYLALKYQQPVAVLTLTESMQRLLDRMLGDLCGAERCYIKTMTISAFIKEILHRLIPDFLSSLILQDDADQSQLFDKAINAIRNHELFQESQFNSMPNVALRRFVEQEIGYIRGRLTWEEYEDYVDPEKFRRTGRGGRLLKRERILIQAALLAYRKGLTDLRKVDHELLAEICYKRLYNTQKCSPYRCILVDEVQDLSQIQMNILGSMNFVSEDGIQALEDSLFLAGDGAQAVYSRGFSLRSSGIDIANRSYLLQKNYRNSFEVLDAAYSVIEGRSFSDADDDSPGKPTRPEWAKFRGPLPQVVKCRTFQEELNCISAIIDSLINKGVHPGSICVIAPPSVRKHLLTWTGKDRNRFNFAELRKDVDYNSPNVKISTIESAKGHEFEAVIIAGLNDRHGCLLSRTGTSEDRQASRLYVAMTRARMNLVMIYNNDQGRPDSLLMSLTSKCEGLSWKNGNFEPLIQEVPA